MVELKHHPRDPFDHPGTPAEHHRAAGDARNRLQEQVNQNRYSDDRYVASGAGAGFTGRQWGFGSTDAANRLLAQSQQEAGQTDYKPMVGSRHAKEHVRSDLACVSHITNIAIKALHLNPAEYSQINIEGLKKLLNGHPERFRQIPEGQSGPGDIAIGEGRGAHGHAFIKQAGGIVGNNHEDGSWGQDPESHLLKFPKRTYYRPL